MVSYAMKKKTVEDEPKNHHESSNEDEQKLEGSVRQMESRNAAKHLDRSQCFDSEYEIGTAILAASPIGQSERMSIVDAMAVKNLKNISDQEEQ